MIAAFLLCSVSIGISSTRFTATVGAEDEVALRAFEKVVRPLLVERCFECHGPESDAEAELRVDSRDALLRGGLSGPAIVLGKPDQSLLILAIQHDPSLAAMPPKSKLKVEEIKAISDWIRRGAPWPGATSTASPTPKPRVRTERLNSAKGESDTEFWALRTPVPQVLPSVDDPAWCRTLIDRFVLSALEKAKLSPAAEADRRTFIRRAMYDAHGLPPTMAEVNEFLSDENADAYERLIDRILASPRLGEHWGRHWLDAARYADSNGMDDNIAWADAWRYRDYVIHSMNDDIPYDVFVQEQVAGDLLTTWESGRRKEGIIATGFLMVGPKMPSADDPVKQQLDIVDEQLDTTGRVFLGLTLGCCRCHDHKYDPFSMSDYYGLAGIFKSTRTMISFRVDSKFNLVALDGADIDSRLTELELNHDRHDDALVNGNSLKMSADERKEHETGVNSSLDAMRKMPTAMAVEEGTVEDLPVLLRGNHLTPSEIVPRRVPSVIAGESPPKMARSTSGRRELAEWLTHGDNPLTGRVIVNRIWAWHFGQGIVRSTDNFGKLGERPDNQPLLDQLTVDFVGAGWSMKRLHRQLMTSAVYRQRHMARDVTAGVDPENRRLWKWNRQRLSAEMLRDSLLHVSGRFDERSGGPMMPSPNHKIMSAEEVAKCNSLFEQPRRTVYLPVIRSGLNDVLSTFDFPDPSISTGKRDSTTVAPQALFMLNAKLVGDAANAMAEEILARSKHSASDVEREVSARVVRAYQLAVQRIPTAEEISNAREFLTRGQIDGSEKQDRAGSDKVAQAWAAFCQVLLASNEFVYVE